MSQRLSRRSFLLGLPRLPHDLLQINQTVPVTLEELSGRLLFVEKLLEGVYDNMYAMNERVWELEKKFLKTGPFSNIRPRRT